MFETGTDLRIGQVGHGLGPRAFGGSAQRSFLWRLSATKNLQNCAEA